MIQFLKSGTWRTGEEKVCRRLDVEWWAMGEGFTWDSKDLSLDEAVAAAAWERSKELITEGDHQLVVHDEVTYSIDWGWIDADDVHATIRGRPGHVNIVCTGRNAPDGLIEVADTVSEIKDVNHAYRAGFRAKKGIDF